MDVALKLYKIISPDSLVSPSQSYVQPGTGAFFRRRAGDMNDKIPVISGQQLIDAGLNVFGLQLFLESVASKKDADTFEPLSFIYRKIKITIEPVDAGGSHG